MFLFQKTSFSPEKLTDHAFPTLRKLKLGEEGKESRLGFTHGRCALEWEDQHCHRKEKPSKDIWFRTSLSPEVMSSAVNPVRLFH